MTTLLAKGADVGDDVGDDLSAPPRVARLLADVAERHPRAQRGVLEARASDRVYFDRTAERLLTWLETARGPTGLPAAVDAYVEFCATVNLAQARYEHTEAYPHKSHADCLAELYATPAMHEYLWGVYLTNVLWPHHLRLSATFESTFVPQVPSGGRVVELAFGHGAWGLGALHARPDLTLVGYDVAPAGIEIATSVAEAAGVSARAEHRLGDATALPDDAGPADAVLCCFLLEHLDDPSTLMLQIAGLLPDDGVAWVTGALTAAQPDHIHEFRRESELVRLAEHTGFRVEGSWSLGPPRTLPKAKFLPRSMGMLLRRRRGRWR